MSIDTPSKSARTGPRPVSSQSATPTRAAPRPAEPASPKAGGDLKVNTQDTFDGQRVRGAGLPIRISGRAPRPPSGLPVRPWSPRTKLEPWSGTPQKPWLRYPEIFGVGTARAASPCGCGLPIRLS